MAQRCFYHGVFGAVHADDCDRRHSCGVAGMGPMMRASVNPNSQGNMARRNALARLATERRRKVRAAEDAVLGIKPETLPDVVAMLRALNRMPSAEAELRAAAYVVQRRDAVTPKGRRYQWLVGVDGDYRAVIGHEHKVRKPVNRPVRG